MLAAPVFILLHNNLFSQQPLELSKLWIDTTFLFFLIIFYPIVEELAFRGLIQEYLIKKTKGSTVLSYFSMGNILTSILFVSIHFVHHSPLWAMLVFVPSLIFGYFKDQYNHIAPSIFLHIFYNVCSLFLIL